MNKTDTDCGTFHGSMCWMIIMNFNDDSYILSLLLTKLSTGLRLRYK